ncbi:MAG: competence/damage-inducible protein A [Sphingobacteriales bacterium]|jgi:nicotinamide-nucleotide amidase|nr:competence/damage-inducible protein A [Sphingobacteriales bacterium]
MQAELITIGDELLIGQVVDTNSAWMGRALNLAGIQVAQITSVSDRQEQILEALRLASGRAELVLITGGLGPTKDDITKKTLSDYFGVPLVFSDEAYKNVEAFFQQRGRTVSPINRLQAEVLDGCQVLENKKGTAPGMWMEHEGVVYVSMPGVPYEMQYLMEAEVIPRLRQRFQTPYILHRTFLTHGIGESVLSEQISEFEDNLPEGVRLAYLPSPGTVKLRLSATGEKARVREVMAELEADLLVRLGHYHFGFDDETITGVLGELLLKKGWTMATAESCTGGNISRMITSVPGASAWYMGSTVTYSYASKTDILNVPADMIQEQGAVSEAVVRSMAEQVCLKMGTQCAVATSGIAGPGGGTPEKPVGTVWIAAAVPGLVVAKRFQFGDNRLITIQMASETALHLLRKAILGEGLF